MKLSSRVLRRLVIAIIFLVVFFVFGYGTRQLVQPVATCFDGAHNGQEEGIDCGLFACGKYCEPDLVAPEVLSTKLIKAGEGDYDFVAEIVNPHQEFGASEVGYELKLLNKDGQELIVKNGTFYMLPSQSRFLIIPFLTTENNVASIDLKIKSAKWQRVESPEEMNLVIRNHKYTVAGDGKSSFLDVAVLNDTDFDFEVVDVDVLLFNSRDEVIAVNKSDVRTFVARTERSVRLAWPFPISGRVGDFRIIASTNIFENSNFIKRYGSEVEKFQEY